jgi:hypothetical protein
MVLIVGVLIVGVLFVGVRRRHTAEPIGDDRRGG